MSNRDEFTVGTKNIIEKSVGFYCSNPNCRIATTGPSLKSANSVASFGRVAHITAASKGGPRYDPELSPEERKSPENGIYLCANCADLIDKNGGSDYSVKTLKAWKKQAEDRQTKKFYPNFSKIKWEKIDFTNLETEYSNALIGKSLNEKNVKSCPKNIYLIKKAREILKLANSCIISGKSGVGKSLLSFQIAYEYFLEGWIVFKFTSGTNTDLIEVPIHEEIEIILIIDSAHRLGRETLEALEKLSTKNVFVIFNWNSSILSNDPFLESPTEIEINPKEQVRILKKFCEKNALQIEQKLKFSRGFHTIYHEIRIAGHEETPWKFNYYLSQGWKRDKHSKVLLKDDNRKDVILMVVALFQIISLDKGIKKTKLVKTVKKFTQDKNWLDTIDKIVSKYCFCEDGFITLHHYLYAKSFIYEFDQEEDLKVTNFIEELCEKLIFSSHFEKGVSNFLEIIMFGFKRMHFKLWKHKVTTKLYDKLISKNKLHPYQVNIICSLLRFDNTLTKNLERDNQILQKWLSEVNDDSALQFSSLINELKNNNYSKSFLTEEITKKIKGGLKSNSLLEIAKYSILLNEILQLYYKPDSKNIVIKLVEADVIYITDHFLNSENLYYFSEIVCNIFHSNKFIVRKMLNEKIPEITKIVNSNFLKGYSSISPLVNKFFKFTDNIFSGKNIKYNKEEALKIICELDLAKLSKSIENMNLRESESFARLLYFISIYKPSSIRKIFQNLDLTRFQAIFIEDKKMSEEHLKFFLIFIKLKSDKFREYTENLYEKLEIYPVCLLHYNPNLCLQKLEGKKKDLDLNIRFDNFEVTIDVIKNLEQNKKEIIPQILEYNFWDIHEEIYSQSINIDNCRYKVEFLNYLVESHFEFIRGKIIDKTKEEELVEKIVRLVTGRSSEKKTACLYFYIIEKTTKILDNRLLKLKRKYPKSLNYDGMFQK